MRRSWWALGETKADNYQFYIFVFFFFISNRFNLYRKTSPTRRGENLPRKTRWEILVRLILVFGTLFRSFSLFDSLVRFINGFRIQRFKKKCLLNFDARRRSIDDSKFSSSLQSTLQLFTFFREFIFFARRWTRENVYSSSVEAVSQRVIEFVAP